jgi:hypothetical protein
MSRPRHKLRPETFPFLAVLLCAMGSLILVLLVMDRRAKLAAKARVESAHARRVEEARLGAARLREEHERRRAAERARRETERDAERTRLTAEQAELQKRIVAVREALAVAAARLQQQGGAAGELARRAEDERRRLADMEKSLADREAQLRQSAQGTEAAHAMMVRMSADLVHAEETLKALRAARARERQTYSVVPYKGKQGDSRRPIYVECAAAGVVFHPDRLALDPALSPYQVRAEVERRFVRQRELLPTGGDLPTDLRPYVMVLIRPAGVANYYALQAALRGSGVDFGYEFVDADWVFEFPEEESRSIVSATNSSDPTATARGVPGGQGGGGSATAPGPLNRGGGEGSADASRSPGPIRGFRAGVEIRTPLPGGSGGGFGTSGGTHPTGPAGPPAGASLASPGGPSGPNTRGGDSSPASLGQPEGAGEHGTDMSGTGRGGSAALPGAGDYRGGRASSEVRATVADPKSNSSDAVARDERAPGQPGQATPTGQVAPPNEVRRADERGQAPRRPNPLAVPAPDAGEPDDGPPLPLTPPQDPAADRRPIEPRPARLHGNRDWTIFLECRDDRVVVYPGGQEVLLTALPRRARDNPLAQAVRQLIARKQALVQPGDPPYRPFVRFLVRPENMRAFHDAYLALDALRVPKQRWTLQPEDDVAAIVAGY